MIFDTLFTQQLAEASGPSDEPPEWKLSSVQPITRIAFSTLKISTPRRRIPSRDDWWGRLQNKTRHSHFVMVLLVARGAPSRMWTPAWARSQGSATLTHAAYYYVINKGRLP
jgi:hypothetical protein